MNLKRKVLIGLFTAFIVPAAFAQISDIQPGADDQGSGCGANGTTLAGVGNPPPAYQLQKPCASAQPAFAYADIISTLENGTTPVSALTSAGFDIKNGTHCGGGAPRFEIDLDNHTHFVVTLSCTQGTMTDLGNGWTRVTFSSAQIASGVIAAGGSPTSIITDLFILMDEGTDTPASALVGTPGTAVIDNVMVNGVTFGGTPAAVTAVPTLSEWVLFGLVGILALAGVFVLRR